MAEATGAAGFPGFFEQLFLQEYGGGAGSGPYPITYMLCFPFSVLITLQAIKTEDNEHFALSPKYITLSSRFLLVLTQQQGQLGRHQHSHYLSSVRPGGTLTKTSTIAGTQPQSILLTPQGTPEVIHQQHLVPGPGATDLFRLVCCRHFVLESSTCGFCD